MKILLVSPYFYPKRGGLENYAYNIFKRLQGRHEITVVCSGSESSRDLVEGMEVLRIASGINISNTPLKLSLALRISRILENENFDLVNAHTPVPYYADMAAIASSKNNVPFVLTYHNDLIKKGFLRLFAQIYNRSLLKSTLGNSKKIITPSPHVYNESIFLKNYTDKLELITPGIDPDVYKPGNTDIRQKYGVPEDSEMVLFVGAMNRGHRHKGVDVLLRAFSKIKDKNAYVVLAGSGNMVPEYRKLAESLGIDDKLVYTGFVSENELIDLYRTSSMLVLPTLTVAEGFGMVLIEANACGTPVIGSAVGGIKYVIRDGETGLLVPPGDPDVLAGAMEKLLDDKDLAEKMGANGRKMVLDNYTWDRSVQMTEKVFGDTIKQLY